ncbi:MAG: hypothetical protein ACTSU0_04250 [Alphaproteobacteria bacterium]
MNRWGCATRLIQTAVALAIAGTLAVTGAAAEPILPDELRPVFSRLEANVAVGGSAAKNLSERDRAILFKHNDAINAAAFSGEIDSRVYQSAQNDYADLNRDFAADAAADAKADFTVQQRTSSTFSPGTDSDYITVVVDSVDEISDMKKGFNTRIQAYLAGHKVLNEPRSDWHNKLDTDFMADPRYVTEEQFQKIARLNNDAYSRRHSAEFEKLIRDPSNPPIDPFHVVAYTQEMDDFADKKGRSIDQMMGDPGFDQPRVQADVFRKMALQQKYISRIEMAENIWREQHGLPPRDYSNSPAARASDRTNATFDEIRDAHKVADQTLETAISNMIETMAEVQIADPDYTTDKAAADIATLLGRLSPAARQAILNRLSDLGLGGLVDGAVFDDTVLTHPQLPPAGNIDVPPLALPDHSGYATLYIEAGRNLAQEQLKLPPAVEEGFALPGLDETSERAWNNPQRKAKWGRLMSRAQDLLGPLTDGEQTDLTQIIKNQKVLEKRAMQAAFGEFVGVMPSGAQERLLQAESFYSAHKESIGEYQAIFQQINFVAALARAYHRKGASGVFETAMTMGCTMMTRHAAELAGAMAASAAGPTGAGGVAYYAVSAAGSYLGREVCSRFMAFLFKIRTGQGWLGNYVNYTDDPLVNEWIKIFYTGEIMTGANLDRPDLPPGLDFFFRERVRNKRDIAKKFKSQPLLHKALHNHWSTLKNEYPELDEYLNLVRSETARKIWHHIYEIAGESLVDTIREKNEAKKLPQTDPSSMLARFATGAVQWPPADGSRPPPRVVSGQAKKLGELSLGAVQSVSAKLGVVGLAGIDENLIFRWRIEGPGLPSDGEDDREAFFVEFPKKWTDPLKHLFKDIESRFDFELTPDRFKAGEAYEVVATVENTDEEFRFPFSVSGEAGDCDPASDDCGEDHEEAHFVISVEGQGFAPAFTYDAKPRTVDPDGTVWIGQSGAFVGHEVKGKSQIWMTLKAGEDHDEAKASFRRYLLSRACKADAEIWNNPARSAGLPDHSAPTVWQRGPKIVTVAGPFATRQEHSEDLDGDWQQIREKQPDGSYVFMNNLIEKMKQLIDCGGSCCAIQCTDPFHCG